MRMLGATEGMPARLTLLRWVLVLATVYLVWFSNRSGPIPWVVPVYVLAYLLSTPLVHAFVRRHAFDRRVLTGLVAFDVCWVSVGLLLVHREQVDFYPVVFLTLFIAAVALDLRGAVAAAVLLGSVHLATTTASLPGALWTRPEELLRLPFLLAAASFFGYLCQQQRRRARREQQLRRQRERLEALAAAAHDIRSPLANVVTLTEMVLEGDAGPLTEEQRDLIERAHADLWRVVRRATNLMDAARLDNQALPFEFETVDLAQVVEEVVGSMGSAARIRKVRVQLERAAEETLVQADRAQLERVVSNLLDNAIKYSPVRGEIRLRVSNPRVGWVAVEVIDQGPGIPQEERASLFRPYTRMHAGPPLSGSGLGLYIVRKIVEGHRGTVTLESGPTGGTCARVMLPLAKVANPTDQHSAKSVASTG